MILLHNFHNFWSCRVFLSLSPFRTHLNRRLYQSVSCCFSFLYFIRFVFENKIIWLLFAFAYYTHLFRFEHVFEFLHWLRCEIAIPSLVRLTSEYAMKRVSTLDSFSMELFLYIEVVLRLVGLALRFLPRQMTATIWRGNNHFFSSVMRTRPQSHDHKPLTKNRKIKIEKIAKKIASTEKCAVCLQRILSN